MRLLLFSSFFALAYGTTGYPGLKFPPVPSCQNPWSEAQIKALIREVLNEKPAPKVPEFPEFPVNEGNGIFSFPRDLQKQREKHLKTSTTTPKPGTGSPSANIPIPHPGQAPPPKEIQIPSAFARIPVPLPPSKLPSKIKAIYAAGKEIYSKLSTVAPIPAKVPSKPSPKNKWEQLRETLLRLHRPELFPEEGRLPPVEVPHPLNMKFPRPSLRQPPAPVPFYEYPGWRLNKLPHLPPQGPFWPQDDRSYETNWPQRNYNEKPTLYTPKPDVYRPIPGLHV